jgi:archaellum biogenesis protein FlaJ (TadC family)
LFSQEVPLNWNNWFRQIHRWLSIAFTLAVIINIIAMVQERSSVWVGLMALLPLTLLLLTGLYLFALPYATKWRGAGRSGG